MERRNLAATAGDGFAFQYWIIATTALPTVAASNPYTLTVSAGTTYAVQAIFQVLNAAYPPSVLISTVVNVTNQAVVVLLPWVGGSTTPGPGTYAFTSATAFSITATPHFPTGLSAAIHLVTEHTTSDTPTNNAYNVNHGCGYMYSYQPVFSPTTVPEFTSVILPALLALIFLFSAVTTYVFKRRK